jgi:uncharacterized repeat protein (TIGR01451 family)
MKKLFVVIWVLSLGLGIAMILPASAAPVGADASAVSLDETGDGSSVDLRGDQELVIDLEGNLSTGYAWDVASVDGAVLQRVGQFEFQQYADAVGSAGRQTLRFRASGAGQTGLVLVYRRPWEDAAPLRTYALDVRTSGPISAIDDAYTDAVPPASPGDVGPIDSAALPTTYDWCTGGGCTPVKNQGSCGSCWAFATVGVAESLVKVGDGVTRNFSEQYLVSCNTDGWNCVDGGGRAFDYFINEIPPGEPAAGAVYENDFPYTAQDDPCSSPYTHHEKLVSWDFVAGGTEYPTVAQIKQAIYDHGPVYVSVCAGSGWNSYSGGVFSTDESSACSPYPTNHGVVLVGWDDNQGVWYLRNSWGTGWGESLAGAGGYMRIAYGTSNVGRYPAYAVYEPSPDVSIVKSVVGSGFAPGDPITFTLAIENSGGAVAANTVVTDAMPAEVLSPTVASTLALTETGVVSYVWQVEPLSPGASGTITVSGQIDPSLPDDFAFTNEASIYDPEEMARSNNTGSVTVGEKKVYLPLVLRSWPPVVTDQFYAVADTCVLQGAPTSNFGSATDMWTGYDHCAGGQIGRSLVKFDLSSIPSGAMVNEAKLYLLLVNSCDMGERTHMVTAYRVNSDWSSSSVTWNTQPGIAEAYGSASIPSQTWSWYSFDVTNLVQGWVNGSFADYGLVIRGPESSGNDGARLGFGTVNGSYDPYLEITYVGADVEADPSVVRESEAEECGSAVVDALKPSADGPCCGFEYRALETGCTID